MTKASDNLFPGIIIRESANDGSDFSNPSADYRRLFLGEDGELHVKDSAGAVTGIGGAVTEITDIPTAETDDALVLAPDGAGGVEFRAEAGGGTGSVDSASVVTNQSTSSSSYADLATVGPEVTIDVPASGVVVLSLRCHISSGASGAVASYAASGGNTIAAADDNGAIGNANGTVNAFWGATFRLTGLTPGSTTFTMKYKAIGGVSSAFLRRQIIVDTRNL